MTVKACKALPPVPLPKFRRGFSRIQLLLCLSVMSLVAGMAALVMP